MEKNRRKRLDWRLSSWLILAAVLCLVAFLHMVAEGADVVETVLEYDYAGSDNYHYHQGIPREDIVLSHTDSMLAIVQSLFTTSYAWHLRPTSNRFSSWGTGLNLSTTGLIGDHAHLDVQGDTLWVVGNNSSTLKYVFKFLIDDGTLAQPFDTTTWDSTGQDDDLGAVCHYGGGDAMIGINRNPDALDVAMALSSNGFATVAWAGDVYAYDADTRIDIDPWGDSAAIMVFRNYGVAGGTQQFDFYYFYNDSLYGPETALDLGDVTREFSFTVDTKRNEVHLLASTMGEPSYMVHSIRDTAGNWTVDTLSTGGNRSDMTQHYFPALVFSEWDACMRAFYPTFSGTTAAAMYEKKWDADAGEFEADSLRVSNASSTQVRWHSGCLNVPENWKSRAVVRFTEVISGSYRDRVFVVVDSAATEYTGATEETPTRRRRSILLGATP